MLEHLDLTAWELALASAAAVFGAIVQGSIGFGYALVLVPVLLFCAPAAVPVTPIVVATPMVLAMVARERRDIDRRVVGRLTLGRLPGTIVGAWVVAAVSVDAITVVVGAVLIATVALSARLPHVDAASGTQVAAGFASGVLGTVSALGGPVMGLALQSWPGPALRATLSMVFALGLAMSLAALAVAGAIQADAIALGALLAPVTLGGLAASRPLAARLDGGRLRVAVLAFAGIGGLGAILRVALL